LTENTAKQMLEIIGHNGNSDREGTGIGV